MISPTKITSTSNPDVLVIAWDPTNVCNFKCRYCFPGSNAGTHGTPQNLDLIVDNFRYLMDQYTKKLGKTKFQFVVAGGEPTIWKDLGLFISKIKENHNVYFSLISNGSRTLRWWEKYGHILDNASLTHHLEQGNVDHIIKVADILHSKGVKTNVTVLMDTAYWQQGLDDINYMKKNSKNSWFISVGKIIGDKIPIYTEEQLKYLKWDLKRIPNLIWFWKNRKLIKDAIKLFNSKAILNNGRRKRSRPGTYLINDWNHFKGWECNIALERIYINWTGNITGTCNIKLFKYNKYYNILDKNFINEFDLNPVPVICESNSCWCAPETHISKQKK